LTPYATAAPAAYRQQEILTATPGRLVVMLYDGAGRFLFQAAYAMREGDVAKAGQRLSRAEAIVEELLYTLDVEQGGVVASRLQGLYVFFLRHLGEARLHRDADAIDTVREQLAELREAWAEIAV
jgi:flagellar secretion chaperone FliS